MLAASLLGLTAITNATTNQAFACGLDNIADCFSAGASSGNGYYAGQQDAIYDHDHNLVYNPQPQVNVYHPVGYADQFRQGYDNQWNSYQSQTSSVYINNSPGPSVRVGQNAANNQGPSITTNDQPTGGCGFTNQCVLQNTNPSPCSDSCILQNANPGLVGPCDNGCGLGFHHGCGFGGCGYRHVFWHGEDQ